MIQKLCFAASSGGHYEQLMMLKPLMDKYECFILTEKTRYAVNNGRRTYYFPQTNRHEIACIPKIFLYICKGKTRCHHMYWRVIHDSDVFNM